MRLNIPKFILFLSISMCLSCQINVKHSPEIYRLDKVTLITKGVSKKALYERALINNLPSKEAIRDSLISDYLYTKSFLATDSIICEDLDVNRFYILFFEKTSCTKYYIEHKEDKKHEIYGDGTGLNGDCSKDCLVFYSYYRSVDNSNMWYCDYPKGRKDTIWTCTK